jgi:hypothetical protein
MQIDLRTGVPVDEIADDYEREADIVERRSWRDLCCGTGVEAVIAGYELDRVKRLRAEASARRHW